MDGGNPAVALRLYSELAADEMSPPGERAEALGGIGRCYKEMFLACTEPDRVPAMKNGNDTEIALACRLIT